MTNEPDHIEDGISNQANAREGSESGVESGMQHVAAAAIVEGGLPSRSEREQDEPAFAFPPALPRSFGATSQATAWQPSLHYAREGWMEKVRTHNGERCVSANELTSLSALILYVAHTVGANEFRIERDLADRFNVANVKCLPAIHFDEAIRYLVDQVG